MIISEDMVKLAAEAMGHDLLHGSAHGARLPAHMYPDNFIIDGHVDLRSLARAALTAAPQGQVVGRATRMGWKRGKTDKFEVVIQLDGAPGWPIGVVWDQTPIAITLVSTPPLSRPDGGPDVD